MRPPESVARGVPGGPALYVLWSALAIGGSIALAGLNPESVTRLLVLAFLVAQLAFRERFAGASPRLAQTIGDGGLFFFANAPAMLVFLPYPMSNYHAVNVLPFLAARDRLDPGRPVGATARAVVPAVVATYLVCGALIQAAGRWAGLRSG
jgi:hypothetical protein